MIFQPYHRQSFLSAAYSLGSQNCLVATKANSNSIVYVSQAALDDTIWATHPQKAILPSSSPSLVSLQTIPSTQTPQQIHSPGQGRPSSLMAKRPTSIEQTTKSTTHQGPFPAPNSRKTPTLPISNQTNPAHLPSTLPLEVFSPAKPTPKHRRVHQEHPSSSAN